MGMSLGRWAVFLLVVAAGPVGRADLTLRHSFSFNLAPFLPPEVVAQARQQMSAALPGEVVVRIKGDQVYSSFGPLFTITDYAQNRITLLNPKTKEFATVGLSEYFDRLAAAREFPPLPPDAQRALGGLNFDVQTRKTGQTSLIQGIRAEEKGLVVSMNMPSLQGVPSAMRLEIQFWVAQAGEIRRVPALRELADYAERARRAFDPADMLQKIFSRLPGMGDSLRSSLEALIQANGNVILKSRSAVYIPALSQLLSVSGRAPDGVDPTGPLAEFQMDLGELSTAPIADSVFSVPADYQAAPLETLVQAEIEATPPLPTAVPKR